MRILCILIILLIYVILLKIWVETATDDTVNVIYDTSREKDNKLTWFLVEKDVDGVHRNFLVQTIDAKIADRVVTDYLSDKEINKDIKVM